MFDTILLSDVLEHIAEPWRLFREMTRVLRVRGRIIISVPFFYWLHERPHDYFRYTGFALQRFATENELDVLELRPYGGAPEIVADIVAKTATWVPLIGVPVALAVQLAARASLATPWGGAISRRSSAVFPLGYMMVAEKTGRRP